MKICFYTPFKSLFHAHPSGDLVTATGIFNYLDQRGHQVIPVSDLRCRWIYWKPWLWPKLLQETRRVVRQYSRNGMDLWLTYHSYYKAPDLLGPSVSKKMKIPYVIFQGIYSTKKRRDWKTRPGFYLNKNSLGAARHIFTNKKVDLLNIKRLVPENRITYIAPGLIPDDFSFEAEARVDLRRMLDVGNEPVVFTAAMFRPDVKTEGLTWVIRACGELYRRGYLLWLVIAGEGKEKDKLNQLAEEHLPKRVRFVGKVPRNEMCRYYSAADVFVFPGIRESLGMVFLEAQSCGLPVVAFENAGVPEAVQNGNTGFLVPMYALEDFVQAIERLLTNKDLRRGMGEHARAYVRKYHDLNKNYRKLEIVLQKIQRQSI
ncbi:MAG: glycosyltransferase family 4 protein [Desulfobacterales bacterium]|nr:MAG: glycosyltransferase family 4 protein [Desulfobacterales bacterium]